MVDEVALEILFSSEFILFSPADHTSTSQQTPLSPPSEVCHSPDI
jgi:hypothetical protein